MNQSRSLRSAHPVELIERSIECIGELAQRGSGGVCGPALDVRDALARGPDAERELFLSQPQTGSLGPNEASDIHWKNILEVNFHKSSGERMYGCMSLVETSMHASMRGNGDLLAAKRKERHWSRERLARELGITSKTVENHEKGIHPINHESVVRYAKALGCRPAELGDPEPVSRSTTDRAERSSYPAPVVELLRLRRHLEIEPEELTDLSRYVAEGNPDDVESLELELLTRRASRGRSDGALSEFLAAVNRKRVADGSRPWKPLPERKQLTRGQKSRT